MSIIDTHCHLYDDYSEVLSRARKQDVSHVVNICIHPKDIERGLKIVEKFPNAPMAAGIHPCHAHEVEKGHFESIVELLQDKKLIAIGETGFDLYHSPDHLEIQKTYFKKHIDLANQYELPLSIHCRNAYKELIDFVEKHPIQKGILHCFAGSMEEAEWAVNKGLYLSFSGVVTFKNAKEMQHIVQNIPLESILIETDAPFLAPDPHRGKPNEPSYLPYVLKKIAALVESPEEEVASIITSNSKRLFKF
ncbi:MAG: TatD family hydrolase [Chlamydiia bacterium]